MWTVGIVEILVIPQGIALEAQTIPHIPEAATGVMIPIPGQVVLLRTEIIQHKQGRDLRTEALTPIPDHHLPVAAEVICPDHLEVLPEAALQVEEVEGSR